MKNILTFYQYLQTRVEETRLGVWSEVYHKDNTRTYIHFATSFQMKHTVDIQLSLQNTWNMIPNFTKEIALLPAEMFNFRSIKE